MSTDKTVKLNFYRTQLLQLADFLEGYLPLANAHTVDFLIDDLWTVNVPEHVRAELLTLSDEQLRSLPETLPESMPADEDESVKYDDLTTVKQFSCGTTIHGESRDANSLGCRPKFDRKQKCGWKHRSLKHFVSCAHLHTLKGLNVLSPKDIVAGEESKSFHMQEFMCAKKAHEVEVMACVCSSLCKKHEVDQVVDIGSGLGYLSGHLAFLHNLKVLGIDSSNSNTHGADKRSSRLAKHWPLFLANAQLNKLGLPPVRTKGKKKQKYLQKCHADSDAMSVAGDVMPEDYIPPEQFESLVTKLRAAKQLAPKGQFAPVTMYVSQDTDLIGLIHQHFNRSKILPEKSISSDCESDLSEKFNDDCKLESDEEGIICRNEAFTLTGLHTCGGLAGSVLKLFISNSNAVSVCNVGCCYHLIEEEFIRSPFQKDGDPDPAEFGFPLSQCLLDRRFYLGRNARMLACQAPARLSTLDDTKDKTGPERSLYWRAVLQVILQSVMKESRDDWNVGKLASKCSCFEEYIQRALQKLNVTHELSDSEVEQYAKEYKHAEKQMKCFFYLRATLSACIESLVLLDRLVYLLEQDCVIEASLVELFDRKTSPRCWALIASK